jgi:hypothetical protein
MTFKQLHFSNTSVWSRLIALLSMFSTRAILLSLDYHKVPESCKPFAGFMLPIELLCFGTLLLFFMHF